MAAGGSGDDAFQTFYTEVKQIEKRDSVLTSKQQIDRLLRPGASYFNLNPFEVEPHTDQDTPSHTNTVHFNITDYYCPFFMKIPTFI
ncbi:dnaJ homolog subfamily C member 8-like [Carassius carassius]|uniref:dnaJ homolog subfamily C member 8-like n=1 Tax=Carassius carassius TaxID=217509 RepID=UPI0028685431|nr:dnaJ homolog subfamily C member 8-like [Carassius carassius]